MFDISQNSKLKTRRNQNAFHDVTENMANDSLPHKNYKSFKKMIVYFRFAHSSGQERDQNSIKSDFPFSQGF